LVAVQVLAKEYLVTLFGEHDPSSLGHQGAGKMLSDVWAFDIDEKSWDEVKIAPGNLPVAKGWFSADLVNANKILVHGGLDESNEQAMYAFCHFIVRHVIEIVILIDRMVLTLKDQLYQEIMQQLAM
jgi:hypothetical protein